ncbi:hypothetical protein J5N97_015590 [Dioscorea zingiberensis]|uniref:Cystatin domain-containing protein n=1 Tax=Dioscorea zingiberensis TaxID=325984 RepID=A0A9D5CIF3_9LILI|nr:hypothetical protein J5N97_015590 [Dioscorea zingiberensis]
MATRRHELLLLLITTIFVLLIHGQGSAAAIPGGWSPIKDVNDTYVQEIGKYAVTEHNKAANTSLEFQKVLSGETKVVSGIDYRLIISAKDGGAQLSQYQALVWDKAWLKFRQLISFKPIN